VLRQLEVTSDQATYQQLFGTFQDEANEFDRDYSELYFTLRFGR
jgi:hypothetical protein